MDTETIETADAVEEVAAAETADAPEPTVDDVAAQEDALDAAGDAVVDKMIDWKERNPAWKGETAMNEIDRRQATRKRIAREAANLSPPVFTDEESIKEYTKRVKDKHKEYHDACYLIDYDLDRYKEAFRLACESMIKSGARPAIANEFFAEADSAVPLSLNDREKLQAQRDAERKAKEDEEKAARKAAGAHEEVEGQMKLNLKTKVKGDDGSCAEAASECVTYKAGEVQDDAGSAETDPVQTAEAASSTSLVEAFAEAEASAVEEEVAAAVFASSKSFDDVIEEAAAEKKSSKKRK